MLRPQNSPSQQLWGKEQPTSNKPQVAPTAKDEWGLKPESPDNANIRGMLH